ncbi:MAG TPA: GFA family protein [Xanthobacteraceae bacterium]
MRLEGGAIAVWYVAEGEPVSRAQCHCRTCQHISGGAPNLFMLMPAEEFATRKARRRPTRAPIRLTP